MKDTDNLPKRASLYYLADVIGVTCQSLSQTAKRHPKVFVRGADDKFSVRKILSFMESNARHKVRKRKSTKAFSPLETALKAIKSPLERLKVEDLIFIIQESNKAYIASLEALLKGYEKAHTIEAIKDFNERYKALQEVQDKLLVKAGYHSNKRSNK